MPSRASLEDRKNISFIVVINYEETTARYDPGTTFVLLSMQNGIVDETLTVRAIRSEPYCEFSKPVASALNSFSNPHSYCVLSDPIHSVTEPAPLEDNRNISFFFTGNLCYSGTTTPSTICWAFMTIHNSSQSHYHIIYLVTNHSLQNVSLSL